MARFNQEQIELLMTTCSVVMETCPVVMETCPVVIVGLHLHTLLLHNIHSGLVFIRNLPAAYL